MTDLQAALHSASNGSTPPAQSKDAYGEKYAFARKAIMENAEDSAKVYDDLAAKHAKIAEDYGQLAKSVREAAIKAAEDYIKSLIRVDKATAALNDPD